MRPFVITSPTFTSAEPPTQKDTPGFRPSLGSGSKGGSNDSVLRREMASRVDPGFVGHFRTSSLLWPRGASGKAQPRDES